jgi:hypothetical protein
MVRTATLISFLALVMMACSDGEDSAEHSSAVTAGSCPDGQQNVYDSWYAVPECKAYYDCVIASSCDSAADDDACQNQAEASLQSAYCYPEGASVPRSSWAQVCTAARDAAASSFEACE